VYQGLSGVTVTLYFGNAYVETDTVFVALAVPTVAASWNVPMLTTWPSVKSVDARPYVSLCNVFLKTLLPLPSAISNSTGCAVTGACVVASSASARRWMTCPGW
jgi:hypothetical protein